MTPPFLLAPLKHETFFHLAVPVDFYWLCREPVVLAGMAYPTWPPLWAEMYAAGLCHVVCLTADEFPYDPAPLNRLGAVALQDSLCKKSRKIGSSKPNEGDISQNYRLTVSSK